MGASVTGRGGGHGAGWGRRGRRRRWLVLLAFALPLAGMGGLVLALPDVYRSTALLSLEPSPAPDGSRTPIVPEEIEARLNAVIDKGLRESSRDDLVRRVRREDIHLELKAVDPWWPARPVVFALSYRGPDPQMAAAVTNRLASLYVTENPKPLPPAPTGPLEVLHLQLNEARRRLDEQAGRLGALRGRLLSQPPRDAAMSAATLEASSHQLALNRAATLRITEAREATMRQLAQAEAMLAASSPDALLARRRQELQSLRQTHTDKWPEIVRIRHEITTLERELADGRAVTESVVGSEQAAPSADVARLRATLRVADIELARLQTDAEALRRPLSAAPVRPRSADRLEQELRELTGHYESTLALHASLLRRSEEAQLAERSRRLPPRESFRILTTAVAPASPLPPTRPQLVLVAVALSVVLGAAARVLVEVLDTSFHSAAELRRLTGVPVIVSMSEVLVAAAARRRRRRRWLVTVGVVTTLALVGLGSYLIGLGSEQLVRLLSRLLSRLGA